MEIKETERHQLTVDHSILPSRTTVSDRSDSQTYFILFRDGDENHLNLIDMLGICLGLYASKVNMHGMCVTKYNKMHNKKVK